MDLRGRAPGSSPGSSPAVPHSRLPTKKASFNTLRGKNVVSHRPSSVPLSVLPSISIPLSPSAFSDTSNGTNGNGNGNDLSFPVPLNGFGYAGNASASRRSSSSSSARSDLRGRRPESRASAHHSAHTRIPRLSPSAPPSAASTPASATSMRHPQQHQRMAVVGLPSPTPKRPISIRDAFHLAQTDDHTGGDSTLELTTAEAAAQGSPSPAPRPWRGSVSGSVKGTPTPTPTPGPAVRHSPGKDDSTSSSSKSSGNLFSPRARVSPKIVVAGRELHRRASNSSLGERSKVPISTAAAAGRSPLPGMTTGLLPSWNGLGKPASSLRRMASAPHVEAASLSASSTPEGPPPLPLLRSPSKSFVWDADADFDFTARDLVVSESPPLRSAARLGIGDGLRETGSVRQREREREHDAAFQFDETPKDRERGHRDPDDPLQGLSAQAEQQQKATSEPKPESKPRRFWLPAERTNKKIDEIQALEKQVLSKTAVSAAKLEEIRQRNGEWVPPDRRRQASADESSGDIATANPANPTNPTQRTLDQGERIPNTPVTIYRTKDRGNVSHSSREIQTALTEHGGQTKTERTEKTETQTQTQPEKQKGSVSPQRRPSASHTRSESQELLRKLARVTTSVAAAENKDFKPGDDGAAADRNLRLPRARDADTLRPAVGFASLRRVPSNESASTKRSSVVHSDTDPVDRIEAEMKLFAPAENHSEPGSIRAPSPDGDNEDDLDDLDEKDENDRDRDNKRVPSDEVDATPKATKTLESLLMQPTPRVTGAYVETPVTVRTEKMLDAIYSTDEVPAIVPRPVSPTKVEKRLSVPSLVSMLRGPATAADVPKGASSSSSQVLSSSRSQSRSRSRPRSRSASKAEMPFNSAKVATAHEDLLALQKTLQVDDSTLDHFDTLLQTQRKTQQDGGNTDEGRTKAPPALDDDDRGTKEEADEAQLRRMSRSINTYIMDVQTAKKDLERLEDQVSGPGLRLQGADADVDDTETMLTPAPDKQRPRLSQELRQRKKTTALETVAAAAAALEVQRLRTMPAATATPSGPQRRPWTVLSMLLMLAALWVALETTTCALYCRPMVCGGRVLGVGRVADGGCVWSPDDPTFGKALPVKADQWLTGGRGSALTAWVGETVGDWVADAWDVATGTDLRAVDPTFLSFEEKRRHRRRLQKRGLVAPWTVAAEVRPKLEVWRRAREMREREAAGRRQVFNEADDDDGYDRDRYGRGSSERMGGDEPVVGGDEGGNWWW